MFEKKIGYVINSPVGKITSARDPDVYETEADAVKVVADYLRDKVHNTSDAERHLPIDIVRVVRFQMVK